MEKVADGHFPTPSLAGQELGKLVYLFSELENLRQELRSRQIVSSSKPSLVWWLGLLIAAGIILLLILWKVGK
jgi:hypothetical protein